MGMGYRMQLPELTHEDIALRPVGDRFRTYYNDQRTRQDLARDEDATAAMTKDLEAEKMRLQQYRSMLYQQPPQMPQAGQMNDAETLAAALGVS